MEFNPEEIIRQSQLEEQEFEERLQNVSKGNSENSENNNGEEEKVETEEILDQVEIIDIENDIKNEETVKVKQKEEKIVEIPKKVGKKSKKSSNKNVKVNIETIKEEDNSEEIVLESSEIPKEEKKKYTLGYIEDEIAKKEQELIDTLTNDEEFKKAVELEEKLENKSVLDTFNEIKEEEIELEKSDTVIKEHEEDIPKEIKEVREKYNRKMEKINVDTNTFEEPIHLTSDNPFLEKLEKFNPKKEEINIVDFDDLDNSDSKTLELLNKYLNPKTSPLIAPRITRIPLLLSGYFAEIRAYCQDDIFAVNRQLNKGIPYGQMLLKEIESIWNHISWDSRGYYKDFNQFLMNTKAEDLDILYFGARDATWPLSKEYTITCHCDNQFDVVKSNRELLVVLQRGMQPETIKKILTGTIPESSMRELPIYLEAQSIFEKMLKNKMIIEFGSPSLRDYIEWCLILEDAFSDKVPDFSIIEDVYNPKPNKWHKYLRLFTFIRRLSIPMEIGKNEEGKTILGYRGINAIKSDKQDIRDKNKRYIIEIIKNIDSTTFADVFVGKEIRSLWTLKGIKHRVGDVCPACKREIGFYLSKITFFQEAEHAARMILRRD